jgi:hypothetical protein
MTTGISVTIEEITPEIAKEWLYEHNNHNRSLRRRVVERYADAMRRGEWMTNGDAIRVAKDGTILDGQHRLAAIVASGMTITAVVVRGLDYVTQETIDVGTKRSLADMLKLRGEGNYYQLAAALAWLHRYHQGKMSTTMYPTHQQAFALLEDSPGLRNSISMGHRLGERLRYPAGLGTLLHFIFSDIDEIDAIYFFEHLLTGADLSDGHAIFALRRVLERELIAVQRMEQYRLAALTIKAWNGYRKGQEVKVLSWKSGGATPEPFPVPV